MRFALEPKGLIPYLPPTMRNLFHIALVSLLLFACQDETSEGASDTAPPGSGDASMSDLLPDDGVPFIDAGLMRPETDGGAGSSPDASSLDNACTEPPTAPAQPALNLQARCRAAGGQLRIRDLRDHRCPDAPVFRDQDGDGFSDEREDVVLENAVVTAVYGDAFAIQDPEGGSYSGLWVFSRERDFSGQLQRGARVRVRGSLLEFYTLTELQLGREDDALEVLSQGPAPMPILISDPSRIADGGDLTEAFESVLVEIQNVSVRTTAPDCPRDFDMFVVSGELRIEDEVELNYEPSRGDFIGSAIGVLHFSFDHQKIIPRDDQDLVTTHCGGVPDKCEASECIVEIGAPELGTVVITEIQDDPRGRDTGREFVELHNVTDAPINLDGWWLQNCADVKAPLSGRINPGEYLVFAGERNRRENGGVNADGDLDILQLSNGQGSLLLFTSEAVLVDQVRYDDEAPWPSRETGHSLQLTSSRADNSNGATWRAARDEYGDGGWGSPGRR